MVAPVVEQFPVRTPAQHMLGTNGVLKPVRVGDVIVPLNAVAIGAETAVWTPTGSLFVRMFGFCLSFGTAAGNVLVKDNTGGTTRLVIPKCPLDTPIVCEFKNGIVSAFPSFPITFTGVATQTVSGFLWGTEEGPL